MVLSEGLKKNSQHCIQSSCLILSMSATEKRKKMSGPRFLHSWSKVNVNQENLVVNESWNNISDCYVTLFVRKRSSVCDV